MQVAVMLQTVDCHRSPVIVPQPSTRWTQQTSSPWDDGAAEGDCGWGTEPGITPINLTSVRTDSAPTTGVYSALHTCADNQQIFTGVSSLRKSK